MNHEINDYTQHMPDKEAVRGLFQLVHVLYCVRDSSFDLFLQSVRSRFQHKRHVDEDIKFLVEMYTGKSLIRQEKTQEAVETFEELFQFCYETMTINDRDLFNLQMELASAYRANAQIDRAIELFEHVVKIKKN